MVSTGRIPLADSSPPPGPAVSPLVVPCLYRGTLRHRRFRPAPHEFSYSLFMVFLDIDRIPGLMRTSAWYSYNRWNWASFDERDHFGDPRKALRERLAQDAAAQGLRLPEGPVFLLTHLRYLGYSFNPVSFYYCYNSMGRLELLLAEVNNTFGESRNYWLSESCALPARGVRRFRAQKALHVSPFLQMELDYEFTFRLPGDKLAVHMKTLEGERVWTDATLSLRRRPWTAAELRRVLLAYPWMTAKVIAAIHWQALRLYGKKVPFYPNPHKAGRARFRPKGISS